MDPCNPGFNPCVPVMNPCFNPYVPVCNSGFNPCVPVMNPCFNPYAPVCYSGFNPCAPVVIPGFIPFLPGCNPSGYEAIWHEECLPNFTEMILNSCQCPTEDKIYVMYHGTTYDLAKKIIKHGFKQSKGGMLGRGVYVSRDMQKAMRYPQNVQCGKVVLKLRVNVGKVKRIKRQGHPLQKTWHDHGYDTAWVPPNTMNPSGMEEDCVWDPKRIKIVDIAWA